MTDAEAERAELEAQVRRGAWLPPAKVGKLLMNTSPSTIDNWIRRGHLRVRRHPVNGYRTVDPADVLRLLEQMRQEPTES